MSKTYLLHMLTKCQEMACIIEAHLCLVFLTNQPLRSRFCANFPHHKKVAAIALQLRSCRKMVKKKQQQKLHSFNWMDKLR